MPFKIIIQKIVNIENNFNVNAIQYNNIKLWPLLRTDLIFNSKNIQAPTISSKKNLTRRFQETLVLFKEFINNFQLNHDFILQIDKDVKGFTKLNSFEYNKLMDSFFELLNEEYTIKIFSNLTNKNIKYKNKSSRVDISIIYEICRLGSLYEYSNKLIEIKYLKEYCDYINNINKDFIVDYEYLYFKSISFFVNLKYLTKLFKNITCKAIFIEGYYATDFNYALTCVAHNFNIKTIDIQHGLQTNTHYSYSNFTVIPQEGYELLPNFFWVWHKNNEEIINQWAKKSSKHIPIIGGHIFYTYLKKSNILKNNKIREFYPKNRINILITLGRQEDYSNEITKAINISTNKNIIWHFREHPTNFNVFEDKIKNSLLNRKDIEYKFSTSENLYALFPYVDIHITDFSTVAFELIDFEKVPTIFTKFNESFSNVNGFYYSSDANKILETIEWLIKNFNEIKKNIQPNYINYGVSYISNAVKKIQG